MQQGWGGWGVGGWGVGKGELGLGDLYEECIYQTLFLGAVILVCYVGMN